MDRRTLLSTAAAAAAFAPQMKAARLPIDKAVLGSMLPKDLPDWKAKYEVAKQAGFTHIEMGTVTDAREEAAIAKAASDVGLKIHSVMNMAHWGNPLNSSDPAVVEKGREGMRTSIRNAQAWGAQTVLLVPAVVSANASSYQEAWDKSTLEIKKLIPTAEKAKVIIAVENVWNKFLLSPLEMARYVDQFKSPYLKTYLDVGNMVLFGYPQDWIRALGKRIVKLHIKDFTFKDRVGKFTELYEGEIDWKAVHAALAEIGYRGQATVELHSGDLAYLTEVSKRFDRILEGA